MKLSLDALTVLDAIARYGSFAAAATALHRVPSAITYTVQKLEQDLDVALFDRSGHRARLTRAGQELLDQGRLLLQSAGQLEERVRRAAQGWESELRIAVADLIPVSHLYGLLESFYKQHCSTALRLSREVYGGCWDALVDRRADLVIGAPGEGPSGGGYQIRPLGEVAFVFAVAPSHPLASLPEPLSSTDVMRYRAVSAADSSRHLPPRSSGLLSGQEVLTVPDMAAKVEAQRLALGVGFLPRAMISAELAAGQLVEKQVSEPKPAASLSLAWRSDHVGGALQWFLQELAPEEVRAKLLR